MKTNIEDLKRQKEKVENDFKEEITKVETQLTHIKCELATVSYEKELQNTKYKKYIEKLKGKLSSMGFTFQQTKKQ